MDIPLHVSMMTILAIAWDRRRHVSRGTLPRRGACYIIICSWILAFCVVLPYPIYTTYLDLGMYISQFDGVGICAVNYHDDMRQYTQVLFLVLYVLPFSLSGYFYTRSWKLLEEEEKRRRKADEDAVGGTHIDMSDPQDKPRRRSEPERFQLDVPKEKRTIIYLIVLTAVFAFCLSPLMLLRVAKLALTETYENSGHFDLMYTTFVWIAFLPTTSTPAIYAAWTMSRATKERLRGYLRLSTRQTCAEPQVVFSTHQTSPALPHHSIS